MSTTADPAMDGWTLPDPRRWPDLAIIPRTRVRAAIAGALLRRVAARLERLDRKARPFELVNPVRLEGLPLGATVVLQDLQHGKAAPQRPFDPLGAEYPHRRLRLPQQQKPCRVVDFRVRQQHAGDRRDPDAVQLTSWERLELLARFG